MKKPIFFSLLFISIVFAISNISAQWQPEVRLTNDATESYTSFGNARCIAVDGDIVHVVWYDGVTVGEGNWEIYYKRSTDKGLTWSDDVNLSNDEFISYNPAIAISGSYVHVAWYDNRDGNWEEYYKRSIDGGITWGPVIRLTNDNAGSGHCSIAASGLNVHLVWYDTRDGNYEIYYKRSIDGGNNWSADLRLSNTAAESYQPAVAVSGSVVHVVWYDGTNGKWEIYYKRSTDGGITWGADTRLANNRKKDFMCPTLAVSGSNVHIVWIEIRSGSMGYLHYKHSVNGGLSWGADTKLSNSTFNNEFPSLAVNGSAVHLVFMRPVQTNWEIFYLSSANNGTEWGSDVQLTNDPDVSSVPSIAVSGSDIHVIFRDWRDGNSEIYYKRYINTPAVTIFEDDAENGFGNWITNQGWTTIAQYSHSPVNSFTDSPGGNYANKADNSMTLKTALNTLTYNDLKLSFWHRYSTQANKDFCRVEVSSNNGTSWQQVASYSGNLSTITQVELDISSYANNSANVKIRFRLTSDKKTNADGWYVDDIKITGKSLGDNFTGNKENNNVPEKYSLGQNYPNPFNPMTNIRYTLPKNSFVSLKVYDVLGKEVTTLVNESLSPGTYEAIFDATKYSSGVYFYKLEAGVFAKTRRMMLIK